MYRCLLILLCYPVSDLYYLYCDLGIPLHEWLSEIRSKCCSLVRIMIVRVRSWICNMPYTTGNVIAAYQMFMQQFTMTLISILTNEII